MPLAQKNGVTLHLQELGEAGSPVVMLHGLLVGCLATWYFTTAPLLAKTHRVVLYDLRGHGRSERAKSGYDVATMSADLDAVVSELGSDKVTLVGHSYGAVVALRYALDHPDRVARLAIVERAAAAVAPRGAGLVPREEPGRDGRRAPGRPPGGPRPQRAPSGEARRITPFPRAGELALRRPAARARLRRRRAPDARLSGALRLRLAIELSPWSARARARTLPRARLVTIEGGHFLPVEAPHALGQALVEFLDG